MVNWWKDNQKFFSMGTSGKNNIKTLEFESGKTRDYLLDSSPRKTHSVSFKIENRTEESTFWNWYANTLLSRTQTISLIDFVSGTGTKEYKMTEEPQTNDSQYPKEFTTAFEEV